MTETDAIEICREAIMAMIFISGPIMIVMLVVGVIISLLQALTQIQEQTLTFVPKMLLVFASMILFMPFMLNTLTDFWHSIMDKIIAGGGG